MIVVEAILLLAAALQFSETVASLTDAIAHGVEETPVINDLIPECVFGVDSVSFILFTRELSDGKPIGDNETDLPLNAATKTFFLVHGFISDANNSNFFDLQRTMLKEENAVILSLDWTNSSCGTGLTISDLLSYGAAVNNVPAVGERLGKFIMYIKDYYNIEPETVTVIGHSLGAHVTGYAGKYVKKQSSIIGNIVGLDVAGPLFEDRDCSGKLCKGDALQVQSIKTTTIFGLANQSADIVTIMNGGSNQPGCITLACSHSQAVVIYKNSIECPIIGIRDNTLDEDTYKKEVSKCTSETCIKVGPHAFDGDARGTFYALTNSDEPSCLNTSFNF